jgi:stage IV sporulation protein FB
MFLLEPAETEFDLRWRMFGIPVRVHPMFWLMTAFLGWSLMKEENGLRLLLLWIVCVFVSILLHELGHVFVGWFFGSKGHIVLYSFGGLAVGSKALASRWQRIAVSLAGPLVQLLLFGILFAVLWLDTSDSLMGHSPIGWAVEFLLEINLYWALLNLLPVWPLDGGQVSRELFEWLLPYNGVRAALWLSLFTAGALAVNSLMAANGQRLIPYLPTGGMYTALLFGMLALNNYFELQQTPRSSGGWQEKRRIWTDDQDDWRR